MLKKLRIYSAIMVGAMMLSACQGNVETKDAKSTVNESVAKIEVKDAHGKISVPLKPKKVVALDNRTFETLENWDVKLVAAPKPLLPSDSKYLKDESILDVGSHNEPKLEVIAQTQPDLVIVGQRYARHYQEIKKLVPKATVIDLNIDLSDKVKEPGKRLTEGLKETTETLGKIFGKEKEAKELIKEFDEAVNENKMAYDYKKTVAALIVSGGKIGFSAPGNGRVFGPLYEILGLKGSFKTEKSSTNHMGDEVSLEAIAGSNPDYILVLDRDAAIKKEKKSVPAKDVIENSQTLKNTKAIMNKKVLYAPLDTYMNESIETYTELIKDMTKMFKEQ